VDKHIYFEDTIAKAILFKAADELYGTKRKGNNIGEIKSVVVPYTIGLLNHMVDGRINFYKIWKSQKVSESLANILYSLMLQVNPFIMIILRPTTILNGQRRNMVIRLKEKEV